MTHSPLATQVAAQIRELIIDESLAQGTRLPERAIAARLRVSRSPVREGLKLLAEVGAVVASPKGGYVVGSHVGSIDSAVLPVEDDSVYFAIADDRLSGVLPDRVSENELMRRYNLSRGQLVKLLRRISNEGWLERLPGHGWGFAQTLTSDAALRESYLFRLEIEPAALLQSTFSLNREALEKCRARQQALLDGGLADASPAELFESNAELHEALIACSNNPYFVDALRRINTLRRLVAYRRIASRPAGQSQCEEHLHILEALLGGDRYGASEALRQHLKGAMNRPSQQPE